ncbi:MAG: recombination protein RecR [FCB group bacterium]|nr:recombination protein RecR [FCB group bacterium]
MHSFPPSLTTLIEELSRFPGIGQKSALRLALHILKAPQEDSAKLAKAILDVKTKIHFCSRCGSITEDDPCFICRDTRRSDQLLCVVEDAADILTFERTNSFRGRYHVLGGVLSPLDGIGPEDLRINQLLERIVPGMEIILATNPSIEGDTTALYIGKLLKEFQVSVTRLARGLPVGGDLDYIDDATIARALEGRTSL